MEPEYYKGADAAVYEPAHGDIFNAIEQRRLYGMLQEAVRSVQTGATPVRALDFGCGSGNLTRHLIALGVSTVSADVSDDFLDDIRRKFSASGLSQTLQAQRGRSVQRAGRGFRPRGQLFGPAPCAGLPGDRARDVPGGQAGRHSLHRPRGHRELLREAADLRGVSAQGPSARGLAADGVAGAGRAGLRPHSPTACQSAVQAGRRHPRLAGRPHRVGQDRAGPGCAGLRNRRQTGLPSVQGDLRSCRSTTSTRIAAPTSGS